MSEIEKFRSMHTQAGFKFKPCTVCGKKIYASDPESLCDECIAFKNRAEEANRQSARRRKFKIW